jgi:TolA-binding protein
MKKQNKINVCPQRKIDRLSRVEKLVEKIVIEMIEPREFQRETTEQIRELRESIRELGESQKKTDEQLRKTGEQTRKIGIQLCESDKKFNKVIDSWGIFVGDKVIPFAEEFLRKRAFQKFQVVRD